MKKLRVERGITQKELAERLNITQAMVSFYENGRSTPDLQTIEKISEVLGCSFCELCKCFLDKAR